MADLPEDASPPKPSPLLALPTELLLKIVRMSRDQDQALTDRMAVSGTRIRYASEDILSLYTLYGRSLRALYATSKLLKSLCSPYVWETVKLSHTVDPFFPSSVLPRYGIFIKHVEVDKYPHSSAFRGLLVSTLSMPNLDSLSFTATTEGSALRRLLEDQEQLDSYQPDPLTYCLRPALATLRPRIKKLSCGEGFCSSDFVAALDLWPDITFLSRDLRFGESDEAEGAAIAGLASLQHLELGKEWAFGRLNLENHMNRDTFEWPESWSTQNWSIGRLRTLCFAAQVLSDNEWAFIGSLSETLQELQLELLGTDIDPSDPRSAEDLPHFLHLHTLSVTGGAAATGAVLRLLRQSPPRSVSLEIFNTGSGMIQELWDDKLCGLGLYSATLESVAIRRYGYQTDTSIEEINEAIQSYGVRVLPPSTKFNSRPAFIAIGEDMTNSEMVKKHHGISSPNNPAFARRSALELLELAQAELSKPDAEADPARLDIVNLALRPLAALSLLDHD